MHYSILNKLVKYGISTFNKPTILQSLRTYKNSPAQSHLHNYIRSEAQLEKTKKQKIDNEFITRQSAGVMMFREFAFQQKTEQTLVPHLNCQLHPSAAWTFQQIKKQLGEYDDLTRTQEQNIQIMDECQSDIQKNIKQYYTNIGKRNYQFNLQQQINKINQMTDEQFKQFSKILHSQKDAQQTKAAQKQKQTQKKAN